LANSGVQKSAMIRELAVSEEPCQHGQSARRAFLIDERLLAFDRLDRGSAWQGVFPRSRVSILPIELADRPQPFRLAAIPAVD
jgi:hypothetical protein